MFSDRRRIPLILLLLLAVYASPRFEGFEWFLDSWLGHAPRNFYHDEGLFFAHMRYIPLLVGLCVVLADWLAQRGSACRLPLTVPVALGGGLVAAVLFVLCRVPRTYGDFAVDAGHPPGEPSPLLELAEPLGVFALYWWYRLGLWLGVPWAMMIRAVMALYGATAITATILWARALRAPLLIPMVCSSGFVVLWCYVEKGTPAAVAVQTWYVAATTVAILSEYAWCQVLSGACLATAIALHGSALAWLPAHVVLLYTCRRRHALWSIAGFIAAVVVIGGGLYASGEPIGGGTLVSGVPSGNTLGFLSWSWTTNLCRRYWCCGPCGLDFFTWKHFHGVLSLLLVLAPAAVLCVPAAIVGTRDRLTIWLGCGALGGLAFAIIWYPVFGYLGDWDIYAGVPYALTVWAAVVAMRRLPPRSFRRLAYVWITLNALHTIAWWQAFRSQPFM